MSMKKHVFAIAVMLTTVCGLVTLHAGPASAATLPCGSRCVEVFSPKFGTHDQPNFVETVYQGVAWVGQPTILQGASNFDPSADFIVPQPNYLVSNFFKTGMVSAQVNRHYGAERALQIEYAPFDQPTGLCAGLATTAYQNEGLSLQPCNISARTVWIIDIADSPATAKDGYFPLVNGSTTDFVRPFGMTFPGCVNPSYRRLPQILVRHLLGNPMHRPDSQLWGSIMGPLPQNSLALT